MEHGASEPVEEQSHTEVTIEIEVKKEAVTAPCFDFESHVKRTIKTEVTEAASSTEYRNVEPKTSAIKEEDIILDLCNKPMQCNRVKTEITEDNLRDTDKQTILAPNEATHSVVHIELFRIKEEPEDADLDIGPTALQDSGPHYSVNQTDLSGIKQENAILNLNSKDILVEIEKIRVPHGQVRNETIQSGSKDISYKCDKCFKTYTYEELLKRHLQRCHVAESHKCTQCDKEFKCKPYLLTHIRYAHNTQQYECAMCKKVFKSKELLKKHLLRLGEHKTADFSYKCDKCPKTYLYNDSLKKHLQKCHVAEAHKCAKCSKEFKCRSFLLKHIRYVHGKQQYVCDMCKKVYKSKDILRRHLSRLDVHKPAVVPDDSYKCDKCMRTYKYKHTLKAHVRQAHTIESHRCIECDKEFKCRTSLTQHSYKVHRKQKSSYTCDYCQKLYHSRESFMAHLDSVHGEYAYECSKCKKTFWTKRYLVVHMRKIHPEMSRSRKDLSNVRRVRRKRTAGSHAQSYTCDYCQKCFTTKTLLYQHMIFFHLEYARQCGKCNKVFKSVEHLRKHKKIKHGKPEHVCAMCKQIFAAKFTLMRHIKRIHGLHNVQFKSKLRGRKVRDNKGSPVAGTSTRSQDVTVVKEEPADRDLEVGPVVFQHMDSNYRPYKEEPQFH